MTETWPESSTRLLLLVHAFGCSSARQLQAFFSSHQHPPHLIGSMGSHIELDRPCANCQGMSNLSCKACKLVLVSSRTSTGPGHQTHTVQYCSTECQKTHWSKHRVDCKSPLMKSDWQPSWELERRAPAFIGNGPPLVAFGGKKYFWGNVPAYDILNLLANEGEHYDKELRLLFAASGDPRNVVKTLSSVPAGYDSSIALVINDLDLISWRATSSSYLLPWQSKMIRRRSSA